ncbi:MAG: TrpB-like pyridoxal phosphate-dependent enzyme [Alphaproteobacteria bacterium]|nr:TrpB-like pyridoxal phosphate-dependent enzyme [Alphaproteobacteria bacterium]
MTKKFLLGEDRIPKRWYNIAADLPEALPPVLHPGTLKPVGPDDLAPLFPMALIMQEVSQEREVEVPEPVRDIYRMWRPTPLFRATALEKALGTTAKIYYKYEGVSPAGSHKPNTAVAQAFYNKEEGVRKLVTETGAGQWGSSLSMAGALFGMDVKVYMVKVSFNQKPYRRALMETYGGVCVASPSDETNAGRQILAADPNSNGSLGIAISEAVEVAATNPDTKYALGSVLNHVLLHQTVIGIEAIEQMEQAGASPDIIVGCTGGGSNFAGLTFPFIGQQLRGGKKVRVIAAEPAACPSLTRGKYAYDFGDTSHMTPLVKMHTLGSTFMPPGFHAGGLRYHGMAPLVSHLKELGLIEAEAYTQNSCFEAGVLFARTEGIVPAPEATHAVRGAIDAALKAKQDGTSPVILFGLCGHGHFDMQAYMDYMAGKLEDKMYDQSALDAALAGLPKIAAE